MINPNPLCLLVCVLGNLSSLIGSLDPDNAFQVSCFRLKPAMNEIRSSYIVGLELGTPPGNETFADGVFTRLCSRVKTESLERSLRPLSPSINTVKTSVGFLVFKME